MDVWHVIKIRLPTVMLMYVRSYQVFPTQIELLNGFTNVISEARMKTLTEMKTLAVYVC